MTGESRGCDRRTFLGRGAIAVAGLASLAGCEALEPADRGRNPPSYERNALNDLVRQAAPTQPQVFPVTIPAARFRAHEARASELLDAVPSQPDVPNEAIAERIARERDELADHLVDPLDEPTPRDRLARLRYLRSQAAEVWGSYVAATDQYSATAFDDHYERLRSAYGSFTTNWDHRGTAPAAALVVHHEIEGLVSRGADALLTAGPFPSDPQAAVFEVGRMLEAHERAAACLADARTIREAYLGQSDPPAWRLTFAAATTRLAHPVGLETRREPYESALEDGANALSVSLSSGPASRAFQHARRRAVGARRATEQARTRRDPATATILAARYRHSHRTFAAVVDAVEAGDLDWPADIDALRSLRTATIQSLETAWGTEPRPLAVELAAEAFWMLEGLPPRRDQDELDDRDLAEYVGTLHYAKRYADGIPAMVGRVVDAIDAH